MSDYHDWMITQLIYIKQDIQIDKVNSYSRVLCVLQDSTVSAMLGKASLQE